jgi:hypothetical protein
MENYTYKLPFVIAQEVIERIKLRSDRTISLIETKIENGSIINVIHVTMLNV